MVKKFLKSKRQYIVLTGDGEFQEGQIYEALQTTSHQKINNLIVIIDHNKIQSSQYVKKIIDLKNIKEKYHLLDGMLRGAMDIRLKN